MIYIVEDDRNIQEIELFALKNSGYQAVGFETAKDFYKAPERRLYALETLRAKIAEDKGRLEEIKKYGPAQRSKGIVASIA